MFVKWEEISCKIQNTIDVRTRDQCVIGRKRTQKLNERRRNRLKIKRAPHRHVHIYIHSTRYDWINFKIFLCRLTQNTHKHTAIIKF